MSTRTRICLVTGANRGIGLEFTRQLLARGDRVVATARQPGKATALNTLAGEYPGRLHVLPLDITQPRTHAELARELPLAVGDDVRIDLLINNAGVLHSGERFGELGLDTLEHSFRTNAAGPLLLTQTLAPQLADGARVVNMSSRIGAIALTRRFGTPSYAISKAALNMVTVLLAQALSPHDIVVVAVSPGWVRTEMGGADAEVATADAVAGLLAQIERLAMTDSGSFFDWQGAPIPW
ncbi:SDR family oxidoreductase [Luteimonas yindakuii]|uniref:SDR family oxidoreductase n=1 Tax=Luteimonas yindakuii TaxID=2565782 RepID=UPI001107A000|nr:SDR family oxidoreductase [Luteimonas yindakuii]QCO66745.2 SDR family oxidoreductase [Luteimonas yindakuii]